MNRIDAVFRDLKRSGRKAFIPYVTAGDPDLGTTGKVVLALAEAGADVIEIGIPFSDPIADGPVIQKAVHRSLSGGCTVDGVFDLVRKIREKVSTPIVFMTYYNIVYKRGLKNFVKEAARSGADGIIVPDLPLEESSELKAAADAEGFSLIMLTSPTTSAERFRKIASSTRGFLYHVSLTGVTGVRSSVPAGLKEDLIKFSRLSQKPLCVGFGVSGPERAREIAELADGVIVGSAIVGIIEKNLGNKKEIPEKVRLFAEKIASAVHSVQVHEDNRS